MKIGRGVKLLRRRAYQTWRMLDEFHRGYQYGRSFSTPNGPGAPPLRNDLEEYFDSHVTGRGIWKQRHYFEIYDRHLSKFRGEDVHFLEVGVYSGGSLGMWRSYLGDHAHIYGVDIEPACQSYEADGIRIFIGDQADHQFWQRFKRVVPRLDVVIDDGGHEAFQQVATLECLLPHLQPGGVYICEDIFGGANPFLSYMDGFSRNLYPLGRGVGTDPQAFQVNSPQRLVDSVHSYPHVSVIERRSAVLDHFEWPRRGTEWAPFPG